MPAEQVSQRINALNSDLPMSKLKNGYLREDEINQSLIANEKPHVDNIIIDESEEITVNKIRSIADRISKEYDLKLIIIDYLQLIESERYTENRNNELSRISRGLKKLGRRYKVPVLALSQLSRSLESRQDKRPILADLRESGSLERDATQVLFLHRHEVFNPDDIDVRGKAEIIIRKNRNGATGTINCNFIARTNKFIFND